MPETIPTRLANFTLRRAVPGDVPLILQMIKALATYEGLADRVVATEEILRTSLFQNPLAYVLIGDYCEKPVAFAVYFHNFSTLLGRPGIHIDDIYVVPEMRGRGIGKLIFTYIARLAVEANCGRLEWWCLNWNEPAIQFYQSLGAASLDDLTVFRLHGDALHQLAGEWQGSE